MLTRAVPAVLLLALAAGCADNTAQSGAAPVPAAPAPSASDVADLPVPTAKTSKPSGRPNAGAQTISGTVTAGVEPNCLLLVAGSTTHLLVFDDPAMRADAPVGKTVTISGKSDPSMMSTCQQGVPFIVASVKG